MANPSGKILFACFRQILAVKRHVTLRLKVQSKSSVYWFWVPAGYVRVDSDWSFMRIALILVLAIAPAWAQMPLVQLLNSSHPGSDFLVGDRFEIVITAGPNQPVSVRTMTQGRTDWSPVIGTTDSTGRWSTSGQFEKRDFGGGWEIWTVGGKLASPAIEFSVKAPCLPGGHSQSFSSGPNVVLSCETTEGTRTFATPGSEDPFLTADGRLVGGPSSMQTQEQYFGKMLGYFMANGMGATPVAFQSSHGGLGDETAGIVSKLIGVNALKEEETRNLLAILRAAFEKPETMLPAAREPLRTLVLLHHLADITDPGPLKQEITETIAHFEA
jgi:hypothetical protein